jgi:peptidoglycan hydrolase-like protein with peptidoglycan-binding domain
MTPGQSRFAVSVFVLLSVGVAGNVLLLQKVAPQRAAQRPAGERIAQPSSPDRARPASLGRMQERAPAARAAAAVADARPKADVGKGEPARPSPQPAETAAVAADIGHSDPSAAAETVGAIQRELGARGYAPGAADGVPGLVTRAAIMAFEHDNAMPLTGEPSDALLKAIVIGASRELIGAHLASLNKEKRQRAESLIRTVQTSLTGIGYNAGKVSGRMSEESERAIREFETDQGLAVTGRISGPLVARLARAAGNGRLAFGQ